MKKTNFRKNSRGAEAPLAPWLRRPCLTGHAMQIIRFKKKKIKLLTNKQQQSYQNTKNWKDKYGEDKNFVKLGTIVIIQRNTEVLGIAHLKYLTAILTAFLDLKYSAPNEIPIVFHTMDATIIITNNVNKKYR